MSRTNGDYTTVYVAGVLEVESDASGVVESRALYALSGTPIAIRSDAGTPIFLAQNHLGSTVSAYDDGADSLSLARYKPWGADRSSSGSLPSDHRFTGQIADDTDAASGGSDLYFYNARYYDPVVGAFVAADPIVAVPSQPSAINRYAYVNQAPVLFVDPTGHAACIAETERCTSNGPRPIYREHSRVWEITNRFFAYWYDQQSTLKLARETLTRELEGGPPGLNHPNWTIAEMFGLNLASGADELEDLIDQIPDTALLAWWNDPFNYDDCLATGTNCGIAAPIFMAGFVLGPFIEAGYAYEMTIYQSGRPLTLSGTVAGHAGTRPFVGSRFLADDIMTYRMPVPDPQGAANAWLFRAPGTFGTSSGTYELLVDVESRRILHFLFRS